MGKIVLFVERTEVLLSFTLNKTWVKLRCVPCPYIALYWADVLSIVPTVNRFLLFVGIDPERVNMLDIGKLYAI